MCFLQSPDWDRLSNSGDHVKGKKRGMNWFLTSNSGQINHQIEFPTPAAISSLLGEKKLVIELGLQKKKTWKARNLYRGIASASLSSGKRGTWSHGVSNAGLREEPDVVRTGRSIASTKNGRNHWKGRSGPWDYMALPGTEQGTRLRPDGCPLGAYSYNDTRWEKHHDVQNVNADRFRRTAAEFQLLTH